MRLSVGWFALYPPHMVVALLMYVFLALVIAAVLSGWHWLVRGLLHVAWVVSLVAWFMLELPRFELFGG